MRQDESKARKFQRIVFKCKQKYTVVDREYWDFAWYPLMYDFFNPAVNANVNANQPDAPFRLPDLSNVVDTYGMMKVFI